MTSESGFIKPAVGTGTLLVIRGEGDRDIFGLPKTSFLVLTELQWNGGGWWEFDIFNLTTGNRANAIWHSSGDNFWEIVVKL